MLRPTLKIKSSSVKSSNRQRGSLAWMVSVGLI